MQLTPVWGTYITLHNSTELCRSNNISHITTTTDAARKEHHGREQFDQMGYSFHGWFIATKIHNDEKGVSQLLCLCSKFVYQRISPTSGTLPSEEYLIFESFPVKESVEGQTIQKRTLDREKMLSMAWLHNIWQRTFECYVICKPGPCCQHCSLKSGG